MRVFLSLLALVYLNPTHLLAAESQQRQYDNIVYPIPLGYKQGKTTERYVVLLPEDTEDGFYTIQIYRGAKKPGAPLDWAHEQMKLDLEEDEAKVDQDHEPKTIPSGKYPMTMFGRVVKDRGADMQIYVLMELPNRVELLRFEGDAGDKEDIQKTAAESGRVFSPMIDQIGYVSEGAKPVLGDPKPGSLEGIYYGQRQSMGIDLQLRFDSAFLVLSKSGQFYDGEDPKPSFTKVDFARMLQLSPDDTGNYEVSGNQLIRRYADGTVEEDELKTEGEALNVGGIRYSKVGPPPNGTSLNGTFTSFFYSGFSPGSGVSGGVASSRGFTFDTSGNFKATKFTGAFGNFENATGDTTGGFSSKSDPADVTGKYRVVDGALELTNSQGETSRQPILLITDGMLIIDGSTFLDGKD